MPLALRINLKEPHNLMVTIKIHRGFEQKDSFFKKLNQTDRTGVLKPKVPEPQSTSDIGTLKCSGELLKSFSSHYFSLKASKL